jgi:hypothetical protein
MNTLMTRDLEGELELAAESLFSASFAEAETSAAKRWHYLDAWLYTQSAGWQRVEFTGDLMAGMPNYRFLTRAEAAATKSTWEFKWGAAAKARGGTAVVRCWVWSGSQWFDCKDCSF